ncbi:MAG TPA: RNA polymerase sigma factor [Terriglobales bacterium]|nr:RNA polymerase sigma factor [Terriglobales bacterium]
MATDEQLILEFQNGSHEAFTELFLRYREPVYAFFRRRINDPARPEELAQETFLAVLRGVQRYEPRATFRTYLFAIAFKILANDRRKAGHHSNGTAPVSDYVDPPARENTDAGLWVREAIAKLDATDREVLLLREYEDLSYDEIAGVLRVPINTVRSRLFRARTALKEILISVPARPVRKENAFGSSI